MVDWFQPSPDGISRLEELFGCDFSSPEAERFLTCTESLDVQAAPGSGKTTLLVAKLALLAEQWPWRRRGICVLSHTNVARSVVEERLARHAAGQRLLSYPHFIGTFQVFAHQYLALPYLRGLGNDVLAVDNARFASRALRLAQADWTLRSFLKNKPRTAPGAISTLHFAGADLLVTPGVDPGVGPQTKTFAALTRLKQAIASEGIFRFEDMFAYAAAALRANPDLVGALCARFPCVFVDEMQDTTEEQERLVQELFGKGRTFVQRLGDTNQGIYGEHTDASRGQETFPEPGHVDLCESRRFDAHVARAASRLTAVRPQTVASVRGDTGARHTLFLFDEESITDVLGAFADLVASELDAEVAPKSVIKALCARRRGEGSGLPRHLGDYYPPYDGHIRAGASEGDNTLQRAAVAANNCLSSAPTHASGPTGLLLDAICRFLQSMEATCVDGRRLTPSRLLTDLGTRNGAAAAILRKLLGQLLLDREFANHQNWPRITEQLLDCLAPYLQDRSAAADDFFAWDPTLVPTAPGRARPNNVFVHGVDGGEIRIELQTIHGAKGETHDATLVLESQSHQAYDLQKCLPVLAGQMTAENLKKKFKTADRMLRVLFVGITRPRHLLCLAAHKSHVSDSGIAGLLGQGWKVCDLTTRQTERTSQTEEAEYVRRYY